MPLYLHSPVLSYVFVFVCMHCYDVKKKSYILMYVCPLIYVKFLVVMYVRVKYEPLPGGIQRKVHNF